jgi:soluble lytic murein transglycosylase
MRTRQWVTILLIFLAVDLIAGVIIFVAWRNRNEHSYDALIAEVAKKYDVDPCLVKAIIWKESRFDPRAEGRAGEIGLMQVLPSTAGDWAQAVGRRNVSAVDLYDPRTNIEAGAWYLRRGLNFWKDCSDPLPFALAEYNAGRGNVNKWLPPDFQTNSAAFIEAIGFPTTKQYVLDVLGKYNYYKQTHEFKSTQR